MVSKRLGRRGWGWGGAAALGLAFASGCDAGTSALFDAVGDSGSAGVMGVGGGGGSWASAGMPATGGGGSGGAGSAMGGMVTAGTSSGAGGTGGSEAVSAGAGGEDLGGGGSAGDDQGGAAAEGGASGAGGELGEAGSGGEGETCLNALPTFVQRASNVMFVVDRSGTMFPLTGPTPWQQVRDAVLPVIDAVDATQNVGFLAMTGELNSCPLLDQIAPAKNNYGAIAAKYNALAKPLKGESPFKLALLKAGELLSDASGDKFIIFVIDGEPDYCNDGNGYCPIDSTVATIQSLRAQGVTTLVAALPFPSGAVAGYLPSRQAYANAGAGLPPASVGGTVADIYFQCSSDPNWASEFTATGKPAQQALGSYSLSPGAASFAALEPSDSDSLTAAFSELFARTASCRFDLSGGLKVVLAQAGSGRVELDGVAVPFDATNGWRMQSETVLELTGSACDELHESVAAQLSFAFPCSALTK